jgi:hypothetical protein
MNGKSMNGKSPQQTQPKRNDTDSCTTNSIWREADRCAPKCHPAEPVSPQLRVKENISETVVIHNDISQRSDTISRLAWLLLGLASLLFLGSIFMLAAYGKSTNSNNVTKETTKTVTREIIRTERVADPDPIPTPPRALW